MLSRSVTTKIVFVPILATQVPIVFNLTIQETKKIDFKIKTVLSINEDLVVLFLVELSEN